MFRYPNGSWQNVNKLLNKEWIKHKQESEINYNLQLILFEWRINLKPAKMVEYVCSKKKLVMNKDILIFFLYKYYNLLLPANKNRVRTIDVINQLK